MNYTDKFHFPQWDETDPILRKDFNGAMGAAEAGLVRAEDSLFRLAYNRFHYIQSLASAPRQIGYFRQSFAQNGGSSSSGLLQMDGRLWMGNGAEDLAMSQFQDTVECRGSMTSYTITYSFTPSHCGWLTGLRLSGTYNIPAEYGTRLQGKVVILNQTAGRFEWEGYGTLTLPSVGFSYGPYDVTGFQVPLTGGHRYIATFFMENGKGTANITIEPQNCLIVSKLHMTSARVETEIHGEEDSAGGILLLRTRSWGEGAELTLGWDGETLKPSAVRKVGSGIIYDEVEFRRRTPVPAESKLRLDITCSPGGAIDLYEWGAMMI